MNNLFYDHLPGPASHTISDISQNATGPLGHLDILMVHVQLSIDQHSQILYHLMPFQLLCPKSLALHVVDLSEVQDLELGLVEDYTIGLSPLIQPI